MKRTNLIWMCMAFALIAGCSRSSQVTEIKRFPLDSLDGLITQSGAELEIDKDNSSDGKGSLKIVVKEAAVIRLFETGEIDTENARLFYEAKIRTKGVDGPVYLEMWCHFPGLGEFFSRNPQSAVTGTTNWSSMETVFFLKKGERPDNVKLNLVIGGKGTVWVDDIRLRKGPLQ